MGKQTAQAKEVYTSSARSLEGEAAYYFTLFVHYMDEHIVYSEYGVISLGSGLLAWAGELTNGKKY